MLPSRGAVPKWLREQSAKLRCSGSTPLGASTPHLLRAGKTLSPYSSLNKSLPCLEAVGRKLTGGEREC